MKKGYTALVLTDSERERILSSVPPGYKKVFCHHITLEFGIEEPEILIQPKLVEIVGYAVEDGLEAFAIAVDGSTKRKDGGTFHLTYSMRKGRKPVEANNLFKKDYYLTNRIKIETKVAFIPFN